MDIMILYSKCHNGVIRVPRFADAAGADSDRRAAAGRSQASGETVTARPRWLSESGSASRAAFRLGESESEPGAPALLAAACQTVTD
jgi:hypothetical protein